MYSGSLHGNTWVGREKFQPLPRTEPSSRNPDTVVNDIDSAGKTRLRARER